jgi:hypothetical protein
VNAGAFASTLRFGGRSADIAEQAVTFTFDLQPTRRWTLSFGAGAVLAGDLDVSASAASPATRFSVRPGPIGSLAAAYRLLDAEGFLPFVLASLSLAAGRAPTTVSSSAPGGSAPGPAFSTLDARASILCGEVWGPFAPYLVARVFGGPAFFTLDGGDVVGGDAYHYQLGLGASLRLGWLDLGVEAVPFGERRIGGSIGASY